MNPIRFFREVRQEMARVQWPMRREVLVTSLMVLVMVVLASIFFFGVDQLISLAIRFVLGVGV